MVKIDIERCVGCGKCAEDCIAHNIEVTDRKASIKKDCLQCGHCVAVCPAGAVSIPEYEMEDVEEYDAAGFSLEPEQVLHSMKFRRSIRNYKPEKVKKSDLELLLQAGRYTATAKNNQDCCFIFVQEELEQLRSIVWKFIDDMEKKDGHHIQRDLLPYVAFNRRRKANPQDDYLFRNAPVVLFITSDWPLDAGLAAANIETMACSLGMGVLYDGYLDRISDANVELKRWLGIEGKSIKACMLLGYPAIKYTRTAPRRAANVIWR
ncbi:MAG: nitroreductase family protein [Lachnospiraceae bacterium]|nr:nitroreductase family protein [Lachnospiraceae bacterium]